MSQIAYPVRLHIGTTVAEAIPAEVEPDVERDIGACCRFDGVPRYRVDGVECPDFDPTIPADIWDGGWRWWGAFLTQYDAADPNAVVLSISGGQSLLDVWATARVILVERARIAAEQAQPSAGASKSRRAGRQPRQGPRVPGTPARAVVAPPPPPTMVEPLTMVGAGQLALF